MLLVQLRLKSTKTYRKRSSLNPTFPTSFVNEPSPEDAIAILRGLSEKYELFHGVRITDDAIVSAVNLSTRYITDRFCPTRQLI